MTPDKYQQLIVRRAVKAAEKSDKPKGSWDRKTEIYSPLLVQRTTGKWPLGEGDHRSERRLNECDKVRHPKGYDVMPVTDSEHIRFEG